MGRAAFGAPPQTGKRIFTRLTLHPVLLFRTVLLTYYDCVRWMCRIVIGKKSIPFECV